MHDVEDKTFNNEHPLTKTHLVPTACLYSCILRGPGWERILDIVPGGTELGTQVKTGVGQAAHTLNNPQVECTGVLLCVIGE